MARPVLRTTARGKQGPRGPEGERGPQGLPATNAAEDDAAIATFASTPGTATHSALTDEIEAAATAKANAAEAAAKNASVPRALIDAKGDLIVGTANDAPGRIAAPANGSRLVADSTQETGWRATGVREYEGTGSPEGAVAAPVGSVYIDTAATNGALVWRKWSGTDATGWRIEQGDTGWVNLTLGSGWTADNAVQYRIINGVTYLRGTAVRDSGSNTTIATLPVAARPGGFTVNLLARVDSAGMPLAISTAGAINISGAYTNGAQVQLSGHSFPVG